jgi:hypothetical protein
MRALVFVLILANLLFFAYAQGYFGEEVSPDAERLAQQVKPERLQLMWRPGEAPPTPPPEQPALESDFSAAPDSPTQASEAPPATPSSATQAAQTTQQPAATCLLLSGLQAAEADRLTELATTAQLVVAQRSESWWVFIPPQPDRASADRKASELASLGVKDFFIVNEGPQQFAISLGIFSREETANRRLEELRARRVRSARVGPRRQENARQTLEIRGDALTALSFRQTLPPNVAARNCP